MELEGCCCLSELEQVRDELVVRAGRGIELHAEVGPEMPGREIDAELLGDRAGGSGAFDRTAVHDEAPCPRMVLDDHVAQSHAGEGAFDG